MGRDGEVLTREEVGAERWIKEVSEQTIEGVNEWRGEGMGRFGLTKSTEKTLDWVF